MCASMTPAPGGTLRSAQSVWQTAAALDELSADAHTTSPNLRRSCLAVTADNVWRRQQIAASPDARSAADAPAAPVESARPCGGDTVGRARRSCDVECLHRDHRERR